MVSSLEPRKGYRQALAAFERLWADNHDLTLVIFGKHLWEMEDFVTTLNTHPELGKRLVWLSGATDSVLTWLYQHAMCLIGASKDEGFGLPVAEASRLGCPLLLRDIAVYREIAGDSAQYFRGYEAHDLSIALLTWLEQQAAGQTIHPKPETTLTWDQAAANVMRLLSF